MHRLVYALPTLPPPPHTHYLGSLRSTDGSLRSTRGPALAPPLNNKTHAVATDRLVCAPPCVCTALCMHRLVCALPALPTHTHYLGLLRSTHGSLRSTRGPAPAPPLNNKTPAVATGGLVCAPPCVCTALCMHRLVYPPPCVCTANPSHTHMHYLGSLRSTDGSLRSTQGPAPAPPLNNKTPAVATDRLVCAPHCVCTAMSNLIVFANTRKQGTPYPPLFHTQRIHF